jgi:hypothetical protein
VQVCSFDQEKSMKLTATVSMLLAVITGATALAQDAAKPAAPAAAAAVVPSSGNAARDNMVKMQKLISFDFNESRLEDVMAYITKETGVAFEVLWGSGGDGLDKEATITLSVKDMEALTALEKIFETLTSGGVSSTDASTWQFTQYGAMQIGPKKLLNKYKRVEVYDVNDLLFEIPVYDDVPQIDLQALQGGGGGGGGSARSPFGGGGGQGNRNNQRGEQRELRRRTRISEIQNLITKTVEADQWALQGGEGGQIEIYEGHFVVLAPDYLHRALVGYTWWPRSSTAGTRQRRYVSLNTDAANSSIKSVENVPVIAAPGGR